jgi:septal ring factor EnvC (AmiA/AmiB activator)
VYDLITSKEGTGMQNPKIEKVTTEIARTKAKIMKYSAKLSDLEKQKANLENGEISALFQREIINEDELAALLRPQDEC